MSLCSDRFSKADAQPRSENLEREAFASAVASGPAREQSPARFVRAGSVEAPVCAGQTGACHLGGSLRCMDCGGMLRRAPQRDMSRSLPPQIVGAERQPAPRMRGLFAAKVERKGGDAMGAWARSDAPAQSVAAKCQPDVGPVSEAGQFRKRSAAKAVRARG